MLYRQIPSLFLPTVWVTGTEVETVNDLVCHISIEVPVDFLQEKQVNIYALEWIVAGIPGNLLCWIELSPYPSTITTALWAAIGGGGGINPVTLLPYIPPVAPYVEVATGIHQTPHTIMLPWSIHMPYARLVVQTPVSATPATAFWMIQAYIEGVKP